MAAEEEPKKKVSGRPRKKPAVGQVGKKPAEALPPAGQEREYYSTEEVAALFGVAVKTARKWVAMGAIPAVKLGRAYFVHKDVIEALKLKATKGVGKG